MLREREALIDAFSVVLMSGSQCQDIAPPRGQPQTWPAKILLHVELHEIGKT